MSNKKNPDKTDDDDGSSGTTMQTDAIQHERAIENKNHQDEDYVATDGRTKIIESEVALLQEKVEIALKSLEATRTQECKRIARETFESAKILQGSSAKLSNIFISLVDLFNKVFVKKKYKKYKFYLFQLHDQVFRMKFQIYLPY